MGPRLSSVPGKAYRALWFRLGGRPWTYILRDTWHRLEGLWIIALVAIGALLGRMWWEMFFWLLSAFTLGYVAGHLFWGTRYIPDQQGEPLKVNDRGKG